ncbi:MAG: ABC transporter transmembrane domain-containing protein, partial [Chloroflexota bacterium]
MLTHIRKNGLLTTLSITLYIASWISLGIMPMLLGQIADEIVRSQAVSVMVNLSFWLLLLTIFDGATRILSNVTIEIVSQRLAHNVRDEIIESLTQKSQSYYDKQKKADLVARVTADVTQLVTMINPGILFLTQILFGLLIPTIYLVFVYWQVALFPATFVILYMGTVWFHAHRLTPVMLSQREIYGQLSS